MFFVLQFLQIPHISISYNNLGVHPAKKRIEAQKKPSQKFQWFPLK